MLVLLASVVATAVGYGAHLGVLPTDDGATWSTAAVYVYKAAYAAIVSVPTSVLVLYWAIEEDQQRSDG